MKAQDVNDRTNPPIPAARMANANAACQPSGLAQRQTAGLPLLATAADCRFRLWRGDASDAGDPSG